MKDKETDGTKDDIKENLVIYMSKKKKQSDRSTKKNLSKEKKRRMVELNILVTKKLRKMIVQMRGYTWTKM